MKDSSNRTAPRFPSLVIQASAGSGKTFRLTQRYLQLLIAGESPERILATTFTKKAAGEIRERVFRTLSHAASSMQSAQELAAQLGEDSLSVDRCRSLLKMLCSKQHLLRICTLDSFFGQIVSGFSPELGLGLQWQMADSHQERGIHDSVFDTLLSDLPEEQWFLIIHSLNQEESRRSALQFGGVFRDGQLDLVRDLDPLSYQHPSLPDLSFGKEDWIRLLDLIEQVSLPLTTKGVPDSRWRTPLVALNTLLQKRELSPDLSSGFLAKMLDGSKQYYGKPFHDTLLHTLDLYLQGVRHHHLTLLQNRTHTLLNTLIQYQQYFLSECTRRGVLTFLQLKVLLTSASQHLDLTDIYYRLDGQIAHLLLDEFQDTSHEEWKILRPFAEEILSKADELEHTFFCVGDSKQAIYGWRGGDHDILDGLSSGLTYRIETEELLETRRCRPAVVESVNQVFCSLESNPILSSYPDAVSSFSKVFSRHQSHRQDTQGYFAFEVPPLYREEVPPRISAFRHVALRARAMLDQHPSLSIGILFERNSPMTEMLAELRSPDINITASVEGASALALSPPIQTILSLLTCVDHPGDTIARFHIAHSPLGTPLHYLDETDEEATRNFTARVRHELSTFGYGSTLEKLREILIPSCNEIERRRLDQIVILGHQFQNFGTLRCREFIECVQSFKILDPSADSVRLLTIHKAKGLEFDVVFLPDLESDLLRRVSQNPLLGVRRDGVYERLFSNAPKDIRSLDPYLADLHQHEAESNIRESLSRLYVGMTRALHATYAILSPSQRRPNLSLGTILNAAFGSPAQAHSEGILHEIGDPQWINSISEKKPSLSVKKTDTRPIQLLSSPLGKRRALVTQISQGPKASSLVSLKDIVIKKKENSNQAKQIRRFLQGLQWHSPTASSPQEKIPLSFQWVVERNCIREVFSRSRYEGAKEVRIQQRRRFAVREKNSLITGMWDRVILETESEKEGYVRRIEIIDFHADPIEAADVEMYARQYAPQMQSYRVAASRCFSVPEDCIAVSVVFLYPDQIFSYK